MTFIKRKWASRENPHALAPGKTREHFMSEPSERKALQTSKCPSRHSLLGISSNEPMTQQSRGISLSDDAELPTLLHRLRWLLQLTWNLAFNKPLRKSIAS